MADLSQQLQIQKQINQILTDREALLKSNTELMSKQVAISKQLCDAMGGDGLGKANKALAQMSRGSRTAAEGVEALNRQMSEAEKRAEAAAAKMERMYKKSILVGGAVGGIKGLRIGFGLLSNVIGGAFRTLTSFAGAIFKIGKSILSIPFKVFGGLVDMAQQMGSPVFLQALEEVRKTFGDIATGSGRALRNSASEIRGEFNSLTKSVGGMGPSFGRVFGYGREGMAAALKFNAELATELGGSFAQMRDGMKGNYAELAVYRKGLGLTAKQQATFMKMTEKAGGNYMARFKSISSMATQVGNQFGYSAKEIGMTIGKMMEDVKVFGGFTDKQLVSMAVQSKRLGVELEALRGVAEGFDDYNEAAKSVGNLNRAFGMQIDSMKLFQEQDPVKRIQMMQKAFKDAGQSVEGMSRNRLKFLAQNAKISEEDAKLIFSKKGLEMDYNEVQKKTQKAKSKEMSQAQVMLKLSKQIEKVFGSGGKKYKGFFDTFSGGFSLGVMRTREFRKVLRNINRSLRVTKRMGRQVGRSFVKNFPGVKKFLGALADFFDPRKFRPMVSEMTKEIDKFFKALKPGNEREAFETFGKNALAILKKYFGGKGEAVGLMTTAFDEIATVFGNLKLIFAEKILDGAADGLKKLTKYLSGGLDKNGDFSFSKLGEGAATNFGKGLDSRFGKESNKLMTTLFKKFIPALDAAAPVIGKVILALYNSMKDFMAKHSDVIIKGAVETMKLVFSLKVGIFKYLVTEEPMLAAGMAALLFGPSLVGAAVGALTPILLKKVFPTVLGKLAGKGIGEDLLLKLIPENSKSKFATTFYESWANVPSSKTPSITSRISGKFGEILGRVSDKLPRLARVTKAAGRGLLGVFSKGVLSKALPWVGVGLGVYEGVKAGMEKFEKTGKTNDFFKAAGGGFISSMTLGIVSPETGSKIASAMLYPLNGITKAIDRFKETGDWADAASAYGGGIAEAITFGFYDSDKMEDALGGTDRYARKQVALAEKAAGEAMKVSLAKVRGLSKEVREEIANLASGADTKSKGIDQITAEFDVKSTSKTGAFLKQLKTFEKGHKNALDAAQSSVNKNDQYLAGIDSALTTYKEAQKFAFQGADDAFAVFKTENEKANKELFEFLKYKMGDEHVKMYRGSIKISEAMYSKGDDTYVDGLIEKFQEKQRKDSTSLGNKMREAAAIAYEDNILSLSRESFKEAKDELIKKGASESDIRSLIDQMNQRDKLEAMKRALTDAGFTESQFKKRGGVKGLYEAAMLGKDAGEVKGLFNKYLKDIQKDTKVMEEEMQRDAKLAKLEAAQDTIERIKELKNVPAELESLTESLKDIDEEKLGSLAKKVVGAAAKIATSMDAAMKGPEGKVLQAKTSAVVSESIADLLRDSREIATSVEGFLKAEIGDATASQAQADKIKAAIDSIKGILVPEVGTPAAYDAGAKSMLAIAENYSDIIEALTRSAPTGLAKNVSAGVKGIEHATKMMKSLKKDIEINAVTDLVRAINSGGTLTVKSDGKQDPIQVNIALNVSAKHLAKEIIEVKNINGVDSEEQIMTTAYVMGKSSGKKKLGRLGNLLTTT